MDKLAWIARIVAVIIAVVGAFITIPHGAAILLIAGVIAALDVPEDSRVTLLLATLVLIAAGTTLNGAGEPGRLLAPIVNNLSGAYVGASLTVILTALADRLKP